MLWGFFLVFLFFFSSFFSRSSFREVEIECLKCNPFYI